MTMPSDIYQHLILVDCDGGRGSIFDDLTLLKDLPNNCLLHLFWNNSDVAINEKLQRLKTNAQCHLHPSLLLNVKNSADAELIYFLGKSVIQYSSIIIVGEGDEIYREVVESVNKDFGKKKTIELVKIDDSKSCLLKLIEQMRKRNNENDYCEEKYRLVQGLPYAKCPLCTKAFKTIAARNAHLQAKSHKQKL
ncbi:unnamed protein product, partial [Rotaria sp. Silwood2]